MCDLVAPLIGKTVYVLTYWTFLTFIFLSIALGKKGVMIEKYKISIKRKNLLQFNVNDLSSKFFSETIVQY